MTLTNLEKCPWLYFGGKTDAAPAIWAALGDVSHYVDPFCGSMATLLLRPHECNRPYHSETVNDADGLLCLAPETRVLMADLRWKPIGDVTPGEILIGFDEENAGSREFFGAPSRYRHWKKTAAVSTRRVVRNAYRLTFDDGTSVIASEDHLWLAGSHRSDAKTGRSWRWIKTASLVCNREKQRSWVLKLCEVVQQEQSYEAGWIGGFFDGEGNVRKNPGWCATASQKVGPEADRIYDLLCERGFKVERAAIRRSDKNDKHQDIENFVVRGGMRETLRFLMMTRPERLIRNTVGAIENSSLYGREHQAVGLVSKEFIGPIEVVALETESHTYIAEGLASHNCNAWRSIQLSPEATADAASWPVSEADLMARHLAILRWKQDRDLEHLMGDPAWHDPVIAGWWIWGACCWIGGGWCDGSGPWIVGADGRITKREGKEPGVIRQRPHLADDGRGVNIPGTREPGVASTQSIEWQADDFHPLTMPELLRWFRFLSARLRHIRILNGDWARCCTTGVLKTLSVRTGGDMCGVFLDPPYSHSVRYTGLYACESATVANDVRAWCLDNGRHKWLRIVLAGFDTEHQELESHGWTVKEWFKEGHLKGGMAKQGDGTQQHRERLWLSPHCQRERGLFDE